MQDLQTVSIMMGAISLVVGISYYIMILRNASRSRKAELYLEFQNKSYDKEFTKDIFEIYNKWKWTSIEDFVQKYGPETNPEAFSKFTAVGSYFDSMGVLLKKGLITIDILPEIMTIAVLTFWEKIQPITKEMGVLFRRESAFSNINYLYSAVMKDTKTLRTKFESD
ncbi:MAG: hypothetical protein ACFFDQ_11425 [Candidatus Thorarchaeota archaeon]